MVNLMLLLLPRLIGAMSLPSSFLTYIRNQQAAEITTSHSKNKGNCPFPCTSYTQLHPSPQVNSPTTQNRTQPTTSAKARQKSHHFQPSNLPPSTSHQKQNNTKTLSFTSLTTTNNDTYPTTFPTTTFHYAACNLRNSLLHASCKDPHPEH